MSSSLSSISDISGAASSTSDSVTSANRSVAQEAVRACWMDAKRSCPAWQGWPSFRQWNWSSSDGGWEGGGAYSRWALIRINTVFRTLTRFISDTRKTEHGLPTEIVTNVKHSKKLQIESPNLLSPYVMESGSLSLRGWWMSHVRWDVSEMKQRSKQKPRQASWDILIMTLVSPRTFFRHTLI